MKLTEKLDKLTSWLDSFVAGATGPSMAALHTLMDELNPTIADVQPYLLPPGDKPYGRMLLWANRHLECLVMNWAERVPCAPHDHGSNSVGLVKVLQGVALHTLYRRRPQGLEVIQDTVHKTGELLQVKRGMIHAMESIGGGVEPGADFSRISGGKNLVTFHLYTPPIHAMQVYDLDRKSVLTVADTVGAWIPSESGDVVETRMLSLPHSPEDLEE